MRIAAAAPQAPQNTTESPEVPATHLQPAPDGRHEVTLERTRVTRAEIRDALAHAEEERTGRPPSAAFLDVVTAHACLETGSGRSMFNFNFGGIKGTGPSGLTASARTHEWEGGVRYATRDRFRAYASLEEGAGDYLSLLHRRYAPAVSAAERGDVDGFAHALKAGGYYTGPEDHYANDLRGLLGMPTRPEGTPLPGSVKDALPFSTTQELALMLDAVSVSAARIAAPAPDET